MVSTTPAAGTFAARCGRLVDSVWFQSASSIAIIGNAVVLGLATYPSNQARHGALLDALDGAFITFFVIELLLRIASYGRRPQDFFRNGWNVFDFLVVTAAFLPGIRGNATLLRVARLARVLRLVRVFPTLRIIVVAVWRSLPGAIGLFAVSGVVLYLYGMIGWLMFGERYPEQFGTIGAAALTMFLLLTLDGIGDLVHQGLEVSPWSLVYYVTFVLFGAFMLVNILIGVVLNSMDEARRIEAEEEEPKHAMPADPVVDRLDALHAAVSSLRLPARAARCPEPCCVSRSPGRRWDGQDVDGELGQHAR